MVLEELEQALARGEVVRLAASEWSQMQSAFTIRERLDTSVSGFISILTRGAFTIAVEEPSHDECVVRRLADIDAAQAFVAARLATYERMWNGCGCKIDYYH